MLFLQKYQSEMITFIVYIIKISKRLPCILNIWINSTIRYPQRSCLWNSVTSWKQQTS